MRDVEVVRDERVHEVIDGDHRAQLRLQRLRVPAEADHPPLAVERTTPIGGPTRPPVVLVHGLAQNRYTWRVSGRSLSGFLAEAGHDVLNLELRGHGLSRAYGAGNARSFDEYVDDLERVVRRCERPPFVVGHSLGGAVCVGVATRAPLAGVLHVAGVYTFATRNRTLRALSRLTLAFEPVLTWSPLRLSTGWAGSLIAQLYSITDIAGYGAPISGWTPASIERDLLEERLRLGFDWTSVEVWLQMARWARGEPLAYAEAFREVDVPLLLLVGDHDPLVRRADAEACYRDSGSADRTLLVFDRFHHEVHWGHVDLILGRKAPVVVWPVLRDWLGAR